MNRDELVDAVGALLAEEVGDLSAAALRHARLLQPLAPDSEIKFVATAAVANTSGLGPLHTYLEDPTVNEILVNNGGEVWIERDGQITAAGMLSPEITPRLLERMLHPLGRRLDRLSPIVDARLPDGSRLCAVLAPIAIDGTCFTLRRFGVRQRPMAQFANAAVSELLQQAIHQRCNVVISGATSTGKTSLLNALVDFVQPGERIITLEDTAEIALNAEHVLRLETRPATSDGLPAITMTDLLRASLRLRPDRLIVGEVRGAEAIDMVQAMNTGHDGSLTTCHANSPHDALRRLETLLLQYADGWPLEAIRDHLRGGIDLVVHVGRSVDGTRGVQEIIELAIPDGAQPHRLLCRDGQVLGRIHRGRAR